MGGVGQRYECVSEEVEDSEDANADAVAVLPLVVCIIKLQTADEAAAVAAVAARVAACKAACGSTYTLPSLNSSPLSLPCSSCFNMLKNDVNKFQRKQFG